MATYEEIHGKRVETFSSDPTLDSSYEGQVWFNSTSGTLKTVVTSDAFISATPMPVAKSTWHRAGTMTAGLFCAGNSSTGFTTSTEEWNGLGFSQGGAIGTALYTNTGFGTQTAGASAAGRPTNPSSGDTNACFEYDGSTWTSVNAANLAARTRQSFGIQTAGAMVGGFQQTTAAYTNATEEYDGTNWTTVTAAPTNLSGSTCMGTQTAAIVGVGGAPTAVVTMLAYDGTNWTSSPSMNNARSGAGAGGTGATNTVELVFGGSPYSPTASATAERWDGTSFTNSPASLSTARYGAGISDGSTNGIMVGGYQGTAFQSAVEEFNSSINTFTAAAWASGATYPLSLNQLGGSGTQTAGLCFGGNLPPGNPNGSNQTKEYDGSAWTAGGNLNQSKDTGSRSGVGTQTATMCINFRNDGVATPSFPIPPANHNYRALENVEEYNGSSWTNGTNTPDGEVEAGTCGTISAALRFGGNPGNPPGGPYTNSTIYWNDSSWTSLNNMSTARSGLAPAFQGTYNAALGFGGETTSPTTLSSTEEFDGTNWTAGGNMVTAVARHSGSGIQTAALAFGGSPSVTRTEGYDGTAWSTRPSLANGRQFGGGAGSSTAALYMCGDGTTHVEEFTGETTAVNAKTLTTS